MGQGGARRSRDRFPDDDLDTGTRFWLNCLVLLENGSWEAMPLFIFAFCLAVLLGIVQVAVSHGHRELRPFLGFGLVFLFGVVLLLLMAILMAN